MKLLVLPIILIIISFQIRAMRISDELLKAYTETIRRTKTELHDLVTLNFTITYCPLTDELRAQRASSLIMEKNLQVDDEYLEVSAYAEVNQWRMPKLWNVMQAGKLVQDIQKREIPFPEPSEENEWDNAWAILRKYAKKSSH